MNSFFEFTHYAFGSVCATSGIRTLALHFGFGAEQACSAAARVTSSLPISGLPFVLALVLHPSSLYETLPHSEVRRLWALFQSGPLSLLRWVCVLSLRSSIRDGIHLLPELTDVFPVCGRPRLQPSFSVSPHRYCVRVPRSFSVQGQSDVFPDRVRVRGHIHLFSISSNFIVHRV